MQIITKIQLHGGSALLVQGRSDDLWRDRRPNGDLEVSLLGGGSAVFPGSEVYSMCPWRRSRPVSAAAESRL